MLRDKLYDLEENFSFQISGIKNLDNLIEALTDWPGNPSTFEEYLAQLTTFLNTKIVSISAIRNARARKKPNVHQGWEAESLTSLYRFMYTNSCENLHDLFLDLSKYI